MNISNSNNHDGPGQRSRSLTALAVSQIGSPPVLAMAAMLVLATRFPGDGPWFAAGAYILIAIVAPVAFLVRELRHGRIGDIELPRRRDRARPMIVGQILSGVAALLLSATGAPTEMVALAGALWVLGVLILMVTVFWKISVHCAAASAAATLAWILSGAALLPAVGALAVVWSRVRLGRHTIAQTIAGSLLGFGVLRLVWF